MDILNERSYGEEQMARELTWQEAERQRRRWQARKDAVIAAWEPVQRKMRRRVSEAREAMKKLSRSPAFLDMCMLGGVYEDDLAESQGDVEDVWI